MQVNICGGVHMGILELFDKFRDTIVLKEDCSLERKINYLEKVEGKNTSQQLFIAKRGLDCGCNKGVS